MSSRRAIEEDLQLGVGRSVIVDLPEDATEIFVGDPKVANAVVRSARRALRLGARQRPDDDLRPRRRRPQDRGARSDGRPRRRRTSGAAQRRACRATTSTSSTVADSIILMGSVASAGEAQKALDIATGFVGTSVLGGASNAASGGAGGRHVDAGQRRAVGHAADRQGHQFADHPRPRPGQPAGDGQPKSAATSSSSSAST